MSTGTTHRRVGGIVGTLLCLAWPYLTVTPLAMSGAGGTGGDIVGLLIYYVWFWLVTIPFAIIGSSFPDIDRSWPFSMILTHRGWVHSLFGAILFSFVILRLMLNLIGIGTSQEIVWRGDLYFLHVLNLNPYEIVFFAGYLSHLFFDTFTPRGVRWLTPFM
jgi:membrane-bound metal-dependent hydrolase YbcI (DUF457 family)